MAVVSCKDSETIRQRKNTADFQISKASCDFLHWLCVNSKFRIWPPKEFGIWMLKASLAFLVQAAAHISSVAADSVP